MARFGKSEVKDFEGYGEDKDARGVLPGAPTAEDRVEVTFMRSVQFEHGGRWRGPKFLKDSSWAFSAEFARRWTKRGAAFDIAKGPPVRTEEEEEMDAEQIPLPRGGASEGANFKPLHNFGAAS